MEGHQDGTVLMGYLQYLQHKTSCCKPQNHHA